MTKYDIIYSPEIKADITKKESEDNVADSMQTMNENPMYKVIVPQYMYKPAWGFPRYQPLALLCQLGKNIYASSVFKTIKDLVIDTDYEIVARDGIEMTEDLKKKADKYKLFFEKPNPDPNETYSTFIRKLLDDIFKYDSGIINKVYNPFGEMIQMRAAPGDTFKKNPNKHGYLDQREELIFDKSLTETQTNQLRESQQRVQSETVTNEFMQTAAFSYYTSFIDKAAYFQFVNSVASQIPIPFGKREICWLTSNPSTDNVYTNGAPLEDSIDTVLTLVYGNKHNLDLYANSNIPEGILNATGATKKDLKKIKEQLGHSINTPTDSFGMKRRIGGRMPIVNMDNIEFVKLNLTSQEMEILNQQQWFTKILWMRFGINASEMGFTEDASKNVDASQIKSSRKKALKPFFTMLADCFTHEILTEFPDGDKLRFKYDFFDPVEQMTVRNLQDKEIQMGINSANDIMEKEGIDATKITKELQDKATFDSELKQSESTNNFNNFAGEKPEPKEKEVKSVSKSPMEKVMEGYISTIDKEINKIIKES